MSRPSVFISYSHKNQRMLRTLSPYLESLQRQKIADIWNDEEIKGGERWREEIEAALNSASVAVLLISQEFLASRFIYEEELPRIFRQQREGKLTVLPVYLSPSTVTSASITFVGSDDVERQVALSDFQGFGAPDRTIKELGVAERDRLFLRLHDRIKELAGSVSASLRPQRQAAALTPQTQDVPNANVPPEPATQVSSQKPQVDVDSGIPLSVSARVILDRHYAYTLTSYATDVVQRGASELLQSYDELFDVLTCSILLFDEIYVEQHHVSSLELRLNDRESEAHSRLFTPFSLSEPGGTSSENLEVELQIRNDLGNPELIPLVASFYGRRSVRPENSKELIVYINRLLQWATILGSSVFVRPKRMPLFEYKFHSQAPKVGGAKSQCSRILVQIPGRRYRSLDQLESLRSDPQRKVLRERVWQEVRRLGEGRTDGPEGVPGQEPTLITVPGFKSDFLRNVRIEMIDVRGKVYLFIIPEI